MSGNSIQITVLSKDNGPLSKKISLGPDGKPVSDGSACVMGRGKAKRSPLNGLHHLARVIERLGSHEAPCLGRLRVDLPDEIDIVVKSKVNGGNNAIARISENFVFERDHPALVLLDFDMKGMTAEVSKKIADLGGFWPALVSVLPALAGVGHLIRKSTSAGIMNGDTGEAFPGSGGEHCYIVIKDGSDVERFLKTLHERCWLAGLGWMMIGEGGQLLERSIVDRTVGAPERLVFEGPPIVEPPLRQDARKPTVIDGDVLNSAKACTPLTVVEKQTFERAKAIASQAIEFERIRKRDEFIVKHQQRLMQRTGMTADAARVAIEKQTRAILTASIELPFDDPELDGKTVGDVLDDPARYVGETLADPLEGIDYGRCKGKVMMGSQGPFINSFAHGHTVYKLKYDADAIRRKIAASTTDVLETFVRLVLLAELSVIELGDLIDEVKRRTNRGVNQIKAAIKAAKREHAHQTREEAKQRQRAERNDPRPACLRMPNDAPLTEEMTRINVILSQAPLEDQIRRDIDGYAVKPRWKPVPNTHAFSSDINDEETAAPEQWTIGRLDEYGLTEEIERLVDYVDEDGRSVAPPMRLIKAYTRRYDRVLHVLAAIATQPIVLADGVILGKDSKFEPTHGIQFMVSKEIAELVPSKEDCTPEAVTNAMKFLTDEWMVDVATDYIGKCSAIAAALTIMERSLLPERPLFIFDAGKSSIGKTTLIKMIVAAVNGTQVAGSAWSMDENERRKAITTYFLQGVPYILWDNIPRGYQISCPHIELSCTSSFWSDRLLGANELVSAAASSIHMFTGNNIGAKGDVAGRSIKCHLDADRHDPENRDFKHPDIVNWTMDNRGEILAALFTVLLGNPKLDADRDAQMRTRFPWWYRLVGSAIEHASRLAAQAVVPAANVTPTTAVEINFEQLFLLQRADDEDDTTLSELLLEMVWQWSGDFNSKDVKEVMNSEAGSDLKSLLREFLYEGQTPPDVVSSKGVGKRLARHVGNVVSLNGRSVVLKITGTVAGGRGGKTYRVTFLDGEPAPERSM